MRPKERRFRPLARESRMDEARPAANRENTLGGQPHGVDPVALETAVLCEQVRILYRNPAVMPFNLINAVVVAYILRDFYPDWLVAAWVGSFVVVISARLWNSWRYSRRPQPTETASSWALRFTVGAAATGCLWAPIASVVVLTSDPTYHTFVAFVVGGMTAVAVLSNSAYLPAMIGFATPAILSVTLFFFARATLMSAAMALMAVAFATVLALLSHRTNSWITSIARRELIEAYLTADLEKEISERKRTEREMVRMMYTDPLTGLPNRTAFLELVAKAFATAKSGAKPFAILSLDLDRFKDVNETLGHRIGDELLKAVAERVGNILCKVVSLARVGGDELGIFVGDLESRGAIAELASRIIRSMTPPFVIEGIVLHVSLSIGISVYRAEMSKPEDMMREADLALCEAKDSGRNRCHFHSEAHDLAVRERVTLVEELKTALERDEFEVYYQPQVEVSSGRIIGLEALVRWNHPTRGLVLPAEFVHVAEKMGSIVPLGRRVLSDVCRQLQIWHIDGISPPITAVNVSATQLASPFEFDRELINDLRANGLDSAMFELELTESVLMESNRGHADTLDRLRSLGVRIAIDDFGTGYSSLEYLRAYGANRIKISQQFVSRLPDDQASAAIVRATIGLASEFGIEIIAEGVETAEQLDFLVNFGCQRIQGYYFGPPAPVEQATKLLRRGCSRLQPSASKQHRPQRRTQRALLTRNRTEQHHEPITRLAE
jgi:diguanylate cyclase (GGDEF)-like protein